jgi:hypothetical protein
MNIQKEQKMQMYIKKISWYSTYVDCITRIINEFIECGDSNIMPNDIPNLMELDTKLANRLNKTIVNMKTDWEFM